MSIVAGAEGETGSTDGPGSAARFFGPEGVATDRAGNVYVADSINAAVRKITPAGVVTTFAGLSGRSGEEDGTGTAARFNTPYAVAVDNADNVYVTDGASIRKITPTGVVSTLDGLFEKDDLSGAIADYTRAIEINPLNHKAYSSRGKLKLKKKDVDGAIADFAAAVRISPRNHVYQSNLARAKTEAKGR